MTYCYSTDEERYHGDFATIEEARSAAQEALDCDYEPGDKCTYWVAEIKPAIDVLRSSMRFLVTDLLNSVEEALAEEIGWDDEIMAMEPAPEKIEALGTLIADYLEKHATFNAYGVKNAQQFEYVVEG